jgi:hypothetical protein
VAVGEFAVGVPLIAPEVLLKESPAGSAGLMDQLLIELALLGVSVCAAMPTVY